MLGDKRRSFQAEISIKYCNGKSRQTEEMFGWNRNSVEQGLQERRTGIICLGAQKGCCGNKLWEEKHPEVADALWKIVELHSMIRCNLSDNNFLHPFNGCESVETIERKRVFR